MKINVSNYIFQRNRFDYVFYYRLEATDARLKFLSSANLLTNTYKKHLLCKNGVYIKITAINFINALFQSFEQEYCNSLYDLIKSNFTHVSFFPVSKYLKEPNFVNTFNEILSKSLGLIQLDSIIEIDYEYLKQDLLEEDFKNCIKIKDVDLSGMSILLYDIILENKLLLKFIDQELRNKGANRVLFLVGTEVGEEVSGAAWQYNMSSTFSAEYLSQLDDLTFDDIYSSLNCNSIFNRNVTFLMDFNEELIPVEMGFVTSNLDANIPIEFNLFGPKVIFHLGIKHLDYEHINFNFRQFIDFKECNGYNLSMYQINDAILTTTKTMLNQGQVFVLANQISF
jgi:hypothetical protein